MSLGEALHFVFERLFLFTSNKQFVVQFYNTFAFWIDFGKRKAWHKTK